MGRMKKSGKFYAGVLLSLLLAICGTAGCSSKEPEEGSKESVGDANRENGKDGGYNPASGSWKMGDEFTESGDPWGIAGYWGDYMMEIPVTGLNASKRCVSLDGSRYYILERYSAETGAGSQRYFLTCLDMETMEAQRRELKLQAAEGSGEELSALAEELAADMSENWLVVTGMSVSDEKLCLLALQMSRESKAPAHCYIVWLDADGGMESAVDLLPEIQRAGMQQDNMVPGGILYDGEYYYVGTDGAALGIGIFDQEGRFLKQVEAPGAGGMVSVTCSLPDGRPVFECPDSDRERTVIFCMEDLEEKVLYSGNCDSANVRYPDAGGDVFYPGERGIMRWNVETGERERLYRDTSLNPWSYEAICKTEDGGIVLSFFNQGVTFVQKLQPGAELEEKRIVLFQLDDYEQAIKRYADEYSRWHPGVKIEVQKLDAGDDYDTAFQRFAVQLMSGEGPDILVMDRKEMEILHGKGLLAEISRFLAEDTMEQIFPGVLECGKADGEIYGIALKCCVNTIAVSEGLWQKGTWDYTDIIALTEAREEAGGGLQSILGEAVPSEKLLDQLAVMSIEAGRSSLVDEEAGKCYFDTEDFVGLLELCKKYNLQIGTDLSGTESLARNVYGDMYGFSRMMAELGEGYRCVGYPVEGGYGGFVECSYLIGVNDKTENEEIVADFLQYLLSDRAQREIGVLNTVRKDTLYHKVTEFMENDIYGVAGMSLELKKDGSPYLPEYMEVLEKGTPLPAGGTELRALIQEEAGAYFNGDKSAEDVAKVIQNRVQLYLDER